MQYGKYIFSCVLENDALLPPYKGSTFRGIFGLALKKVVCALKHQDCINCLLREKCVYASVFETSLAIADGKGKKRIAAPPHPYVIEPASSTKTHYAKGELFDFALVLFGEANDYLPYFIYAVEQMGSIGIGKKIEGKRAGFELKCVTTDSVNLVYSSDDKKIRGGGFTRELLIEELTEPVDTLEITLGTPLRLKFQNRLEADLPFHVLIRATLRRISSLFNYHGKGEPSLDYRGLVKRAKDVEITDSSLEWYDWKRYSNKQDQSMLMGGITGKVCYSGNLGEFVPLIKFCEKVHIGKQTSFGLGKIKITGM
ncbi:MAG: CRISPR-associated protein Cas6 [Desulfobacteraceae bacterium 4484_190.1]|nr:MAG: CRISPR-associated protein Cas6 [Desulfobacteraceae bacterium 4484_190.1]